VSLIHTYTTEKGAGGVETKIPDTTATSIGAAGAATAATKTTAANTATVGSGWLGGWGGGFL